MRFKITRNNGTGRLAVSRIFSQEVPSKLERECTKRHVYFIRLCLGFHPAWFCPLRTWGWEAVGLFNAQNPFTRTKVICRRFLKEKIAQTLIEINKKNQLKLIETNKNFKVLLGQITSTINTVKFLVCVFFFQFNNDLAIII